MPSDGRPDGLDPSGRSLFPAASIQAISQQSPPWREFSELHLQQTKHISSTINPA